MSDDGATLREWFGYFTERTGETPTHIVLSWGEYNYRSHDHWPELPTGVVEFDTLTAAILDVEFDDGFGVTDSPDFCAWSESWVLFSDNYDGAESTCWVPRNPVEHVPIRPGGGC